MTNTLTAPAAPAMTSQTVQIGPAEVTTIVAARRAELEAYVRENPPFTDDELREDPAADRIDWADR